MIVMEIVLAGRISITRMAPIRTKSTQLDLTNMVGRIHLRLLDQCLQGIVTVQQNKGGEVSTFLYGAVELAEPRESLSVSLKIKEVLRDLNCEVFIGDEIDEIVKSYMRNDSSFNSSSIKLQLWTDPRGMALPNGHHAENLVPYVGDKPTFDLRLKNLGTICREILKLPQVQILRLRVTAGFAGIQVIDTRPTEIEKTLRAALERPPYSQEILLVCGV
jgi:hypothetical protein